MDIRKIKSNYGQITEHISAKECKSPDSDTLKIDFDLCKKMEALMSDVGAAHIKINSWFRTSAYNKKIKGSSNSPHLKGVACDCYYLTKDNKKITAKKIALAAEKRGFRDIEVITTEGGMHLGSTEYSSLKWMRHIQLDMKNGQRQYKYLSGKPYGKPDDQYAFHKYYGVSVNADKNNNPEVDITNQLREAKTTVNIHSDADPSFPTVAKYAKGTQFSVSTKKLILDGSVYWGKVAKGWVTLSEKHSVQMKGVKDVKNYEVTTIRDLKYYKKPKSIAKVLGKYPCSTKVTVTHEKVVKQNGKEKLWGKTSKGWIALTAKNVKKG